MTNVNLERRKEHGRTMPPGSPSRLSAVAMWRRHGQVWDRCKTEAIEGAAGI